MEQNALNHPDGPLEFSLVIPLKNEAEQIEPLVNEILNHLNSHPRFEIILVNDGSDDSTEEVIEALSAQHPQVFSLHHQKNYGQSRAILSGVQLSKYPLIVILDGDGQNDPADISALISTYQTQINLDSAPQHHAIMGVRRQRCDSLFKRVGSYWANTIRRSLLKDNSCDSGCSLKLIRREDLLKLPFFDHFHRFLPALLQRQGTQIHFIKVNHRPRLGGKSKYGIWDRLWVGSIDLLGVYWLMQRHQVAQFKVPHTKEKSHVS